MQNQDQIAKVIDYVEQLIIRSQDVRYSYSFVRSDARVKCIIYGFKDSWRAYKCTPFYLGEYFPLVMEEAVTLLNRSLGIPDSRGDFADQQGIIHNINPEIEMDYQRGYSLVNK